MAYSGADLLALQANIKQDKDGYKDEFLLQWRHYRACLEIFALRPAAASKEFADLVNFIAQVAKCYPRETEGFAGDTMGLLEAHSGVLDPALRRALVQSLILMRNRGQLSPTQLLPLLFKLFACNDKQLRDMLFRHIVADIKASNQKSRNERLNRSLQNFLYGVLQDDNEMAAKKSLAVLTDLWRRHIWRDARTVNVIASAAQHRSSSILLAVLKFFLGQDAREDMEDDDFDNDETKVAAPTKEDIYRANKKGTVSSKKKKQKKLKRVMATVKRQAKRGADASHESFAAVQLLHDPQSFAEKLFSRLQKSGERYETRLCLLSVISRVVGVHRLLLLNLYPFIQKYVQPHQRDVTAVLAALAQACHSLVPPETLAPVLRQLVDSFVHDKARPEVMTIGLKTVRELCLRAPLIMSPELLQDLALYKKFRDKEVSNAARGLISLFRDTAPELLAKKDRGRAADMSLAPRAYGEQDVAQRVDGAALLQEALERGENLDSSEPDDSDSDAEMEESGSQGEGEEGEASDDDGEAGSSDDDGEGGEWETDSEGEEGEEGEDWESGSGAGESEEEEEAPVKKTVAPKEDSIAALKKRLADAKAAKAKEEQPEAAPATTPGSFLEAERILTEEDWAAIKRLKTRRLVEAAMAKHGLKSAAQKRRIREAAQQEAEEALELEAKRRTIGEQRVGADDITGRHKKRKTKEERLESIMTGREGREKFGGSSGLKKKKAGGLSNKEKQKRKAMPIAARITQLKGRSERNRKRNNPKNFKGHVRG